MPDAPSSKDDDMLRQAIGAELAGGLKTEVYPRAGDSEAVNAIIARLRSSEGGTLKGKLAVSGFTNHAVTEAELEQACETCMYYLVHRKFCDLPELMLPVEPEWSCRVWRI